MKDVNGRAFTVTVDPTTLSKPQPEFAGIASDPIPMASIDEIEYEGWMVIEEEPTMSIDWTQHSTHVAGDAFTVEPLNQTTCTQISLDDSPFIVDSGAMVHISPDHTDFISLCPTRPHSVKGVRGSSIATIGVRDIKVQVA